MKAKISVADKQEAMLIRAGLARPEVRALVKVAGALSRLPSDRARMRVMQFVQDKLDEERKP